MRIKNKKRYGQFIYLFCFVHTIIQENTYCIARKNSQFVIQGVYGLPLSEPLMKTYYSPISSDEIEMQKRGGKGMDRHLFASAAAATLAMGTAAMGVSTYSLRLHDWNKYKAGGGKEEKKKPGSIDTKAANKHDNSNKPKSPKSPKYYNSHVTVNNYYGSAAKPPPPPPPKEEPNKKQKRTLEWQEGEGEVHFRKRNKFKGVNKVFSGGSLTTICFTTTTKTINHLIKPPSLSPTIISDASSVSSRVGKTTKRASKTFGEMIGKSSPLKEAGGKSHHIPSSSSEAIGKLHPKKPSSRLPTSNHSSPSRRPTQGTLPSHTPPQPDPHPPPTNEKLSRKNVDQINPVTGKGYSPDTHFLGHDMSKHDKWAKFAGRVEDYGKVSAAVGAFTAGSLALHTTIQQHNHDVKKAKEEEKEEEKKKG